MDWLRCTIARVDGMAHELFQKLLFEFLAVERAPPQRQIVGAYRLLDNQSFSHPLIRSTRCNRGLREPNRGPCLLTSKATIVPQPSYVLS